MERLTKKILFTSNFKNMKKFIIQMIIFILPFCTFALVFHFFYSSSGGDLNRIGKISVSEEYRRDFINIEPVLFDTYFNDSMRDYDFITIGDSFSRQGNNGYQNFLVKNYGYQVFDLSTNYEIGNPLEFALILSNSDFFDEFNTRYLVVEIVERSISGRVDIDFHRAEESIGPVFNERETLSFTPLERFVRYIKDSIQFLVFNIFYIFDDNAFISQVYKVNTTQSLFEIDKNILLLYYEDYLLRKNYSFLLEDLNKLDRILKTLQNNLNEFEIELIFIIAPDKLSIYREFVSFDYSAATYNYSLLQLDNDYVYVDLHTELIKRVKDGVKDVYYYDDTHWSPIGSEIVANKLHNTIESGFVE